MFIQVFRGFSRAIEEEHEMEKSELLLDSSREALIEAFQENYA